MSSTIERRKKKYSIYTRAVSACAYTALLLGYADIVQAGVFEEFDNGSVVEMGDGAASTAPPSARVSYQPDPGTTIARPELNPDYLADISRKKPRLRPAWTASVVLDTTPPPRAVTQPLPAEPPITSPGLSQGSHLPTPRQLSMSLSERQLAIRRMANEVGLSYGQAPGVIRAKLNPQQFAALFTTMIHRESNFDPTAVSPAGAGGLGQLMPGTARDLGVEDVFSPRENLDGAARYLTAMLDKFGQPELALAAYNAGPGAVEKYGGIPPYQETQQYVADILNAVGRIPRFAENQPFRSQYSVLSDSVHPAVKEYPNNAG